MKHPLQQAEFVLTAANDAQLPPPGPPEIAFAGRSNAGKSSAINALANRTRLAFASKTPGRTQQINFFRLRSGALLADLPGYGYAAVPRALEAPLAGFPRAAMSRRGSRSSALVLIVDARHGLADLDAELLAGFLAERPAGAVLATKMDKLAASAQRDGEARDRARRSPRRFPRTRRRSRSCRSRRRAASASTTAEAVLGEWLGDVAMRRGEPAPDAQPKKRPRDQGECRGARNARRRIDHREGTRSGRKAGDVAVRMR